MYKMVQKSIEYNKTFMNILQISCLLLLVAIGAYATSTCDSDASDTEWNLTYLGSTYNGQTTSFSYQIETVEGTRFFQDLSHWVLLVSCECDFSSIPAATCGKDGQLTLDGESVKGIKFTPTSKSTQHILYFAIIFNGQVPEGEVAFTVKGSTRCASGTIVGPDLSDGCTIVEPPPCTCECEYDFDCVDDYDCTVDRCVDLRCVFTPNDDLCTDDFACTRNVCNPLESSIAARGCVFTPNHDMCEDDNACTDNICSPSSSNADENGCVSTADDTSCEDDYACTNDYCGDDGCIYDRMDSRCDDGIPCTNDFCDPTDAEADENGCVHRANNTVCNDDIICTNDICSPSSSNSDANGCIHRPIDSRCDDGYACTTDTCDAEEGCTHENVHSACDDSISCTDDVCSPSTDSDERGCVNTPNNSYCDDDISCTDNICAPGPDADEAGCVSQSVDDRCDDGFDCTRDFCGTVGCVHISMNSRCDDDIECTEDVCDTNNSNADENGCTHNENDDRCDDNFDCTANICRPSSANADENGCVVTSMDDECDDGYSCTRDTCGTSGCTYEYVHSSCDDSLACTVDVCSPSDDSDENGCIYTRNNTRCNDDISCTVDVCSPGSDSADEDGCTYTPNNESCDDGIDCTEDTCAPSHSAANADGCIYHSHNSRCDDGYSCTTDCCDPEAVDAIDGCVFNPNHSACVDDVYCTIDTCNPTINHNSTDGCAFTEYDSRCEDHNICTNDHCSEDGCLFTPNTAPCDDGDECTGTVELPDHCGNSTCQSGGPVCVPLIADVVNEDGTVTGTVQIINNGNSIIINWHAAAGYYSREFHIYVGVRRPSRAIPSTFPYCYQLSRSLTVASFIIPFPHGARCGSDLFIAFSSTVHTQCSSCGEVAWMEGSSAPSGWHSWANYGRYTICCCAVFSCVPPPICPPIISIGITLPLGLKAASAPLTADSIAQSLSDILSIPVSHIRVFTFEEIDDTNSNAVVGFLDYHGLSGSTINQMLQQTPPEVFAEHGLNDVRLSFSENDLVFIEELNNHQTSATDYSSAHSLLFCPLLF